MRKVGIGVGEERRPYREVGAAMQHDGLRGRAGELEKIGFAR